MAIDDKIKNEKIQYNINKEAAKISALLSGKIETYQYLLGEEIFPLDQWIIIEQAKFTYSPLRKPFKKQIKTIQDQGRKQVQALKLLNTVEHQQNPKSIEEFFPKDLSNNEVKNKLKETEKFQE